MSILLAALFLTGAADAPAAKPIPNAEKIRCKREVATGSLTSAKRVCHTNREWEEIRRTAQEDFEKFQGAGHTNGR